MKIYLYEIASEINALKDDDVKFALDLHSRANCNGTFLSNADEVELLELLDYTNVSYFKALFIVGTFSMIELCNSSKCRDLIRMINKTWADPIKFNTHAFFNKEFKDSIAATRIALSAEFQKGSNED